MSATMNRIFILQLFLPFSLLLFEIADVCVSVTPEELSVPYVPYVVVDKNKDEFDYERLQDTIVKYLENRSQRQAHFESSTSLYDYFRTSTSANITPQPANNKIYELPSQVSQQQVSFNNQIYQQPVDANSNTHFYQRPVSSNNQIPQQQPTNSNGNSYSGYSYQQSPASPQPSADTRSISIYPFGVSDIHPGYYSGIFKKGAKIKNNSEVTANVKVTTFQPHKYLTTPLTSLSYVNASNAYRHSMNPSATALRTITPKFVPLKTSYLDSVGSADTSYPNVNFNSVPGLPYGNEMKCSLKSSRYVYDGGCRSKKPVEETVCADRCIKYEIGGKKPFFADVPSGAERRIKSDTKKKVVALTCKDGNVRRQKVKLYCKDGTIINNVIRIVENCICQEHSEKVHTTKRSHKYANGPPRTRMMMMSRPPARIIMRV